MNGQEILIQYALSYSIYSDFESDSSLIESGEGKIRLQEESLTISGKKLEPLLVTYRNIAGIDAQNYRIDLILYTNEKISLYDLGYNYENSFRDLSRLRNETVIKDLLMKENLLKSGVEAEFVYTDKNSINVANGACELRIYETALVIIPIMGEIKRISFGEILSVEDADYRLSIGTDYDEKFTFSMLGKQFDPFKRDLSNALDKLLIQTQSFLKELIPDESPIVLRQAAQLFKDGRAVKKSSIDAISKNIWEKLEQKLEKAGAIESYNFLKSLSGKDKICIGLKRGLMGDLTGQYFWFLIPIYSTNSSEPGNAVAMEAFTISETAIKDEIVSSIGNADDDSEDKDSIEGSAGKATYIFRFIDRAAYKNFKNMNGLDSEYDTFIKKINRCMISVNFRREPIYLSEIKLRDEKYISYRYAIKKIPDLKELRKLFIGRIIHSSKDTWEKDLKNLLSFNVSTTDNNIAWIKK
ncbi:MAG: hypothetical protein IMZ45_05440 [Actinobacteria bacterium]|nr:hypothetical protein [Actinomycetota bacterium]